MLGVLDQRFALLARLAESATENVYFARDLASGAEVLVRELAAATVGDADSFDLLLAEYDQVQRLSSRALIASTALRRAADGRVFVVYEYVHGASLRTLLDVSASESMTCPADLAVYIISEVAQALQTAHAAADPRTGEPLGLVHLDVCPANVLLSVDGEVKLKGLDLARLRQRIAVRDRPGRLSYRSPEQVGGAPLDHRSDIFSLGICFYELLTGSTPFSGSNTGQIRARISAGAGDFAPLEQAKVPQEIREIVRRAIAHHPDQRYATCGDFLAALTAVYAKVRFNAQGPDLARFLRRWAGTEWLKCPPEETAGEIVALVTTSIRESKSGNAIEIPPAGPRPVQPASQPPAAGVEPIAALASRGGFGDKEEEQSCPHRSSGKLRLSLAIIIMGVILADGIFDLSPVGGLLRRLSGMYGGKADIISVPPGADIYINDTYFGRTPHSVGEWPDGVTSIRVEYDGFAPAETILVLENGGPEELPIFVLERKLSIQTHPPNAEILINDLPIPAIQAAGYRLRATDTISVAVQKAGFRSPPPLTLTVDGPLSEFDQERWRLEESDDEIQLSLLGIFSREITLSCRPAAEVFIDADTISRGRTDLTVELTFGRHQITLRDFSFLDYTFEIDVTEDSPERYAPLLGRFVRIAAVGEDAPGEDIGAEILWVRRGERLIKGPDDELQTPYSLNLEAADHEIMLTGEGYRDTVVLLPGGVSDLTVVMRLAGRERRSSRSEPESGPEEFRWVTFTIEKRGEPVAGAIVVGHEEDTGEHREFGATGEEGRLLVKVPPGKYRFEAMAGEERSGVEKERIKPGRKIQTIRLKFR